MNTNKYFLIEIEYNNVWIINDKNNFWVVLYNFGNGKTLPDSTRSMYDNTKTHFTVDYVHS